MNSETDDASSLKRPLTVKQNVFHSQYIAGAATLLSSVTNGTLSGWATACLPLLRSEESPVKMNVDEISWVMSIQFIGYMVSAIPAGLMMDKYGSKITLLISSIFLPLPSLTLIYIANDWRILFLSRFLSGFWVGVVNTIAPMYLSEISRPRVRGCINTMYNVTFRIGNIYALISALFVSYRYLPILYSVSTILFILIFPLVPESPHYYLKRNDKISAKKSLLWLRHYKADNTKIDNELKELEISVSKQMENGGKFIDLVSTKGNRKALLIVETLAILQKLAGLSSIINYLSITLPKSISLEPSILVIIIEVLRFISSLISSLIIDRTGSRSLLLIASTLCGFMMTITGFWYYLDSKSNIDVSDYNWIPFICITVHCVSFTLGLSSVCNIVRSALFPVNIKGKCSAVTCTSTALVAFLVSKMYLVIDHKFGVFINFWIYALSSFSIALFSSQYFIETKGKSLQQIQDELNKIKSVTN